MRGRLPQVLGLLEDKGRSKKKNKKYIWIDLKVDQIYLYFILNSWKYLTKLKITRNNKKEYLKSINLK